MIDLFARGNRRMGILVGRPAFDQRLRHQGSGLRGRSERHAASRKSKGKFQKVPAFHDLLLCARSHQGESASSALRSNKARSFVAWM
jgi:hypothetical protein